ncbi:hypothetical protein [Enterococcus thailandicus]|uniref:hypothetical protein n=1 Tax=Enterococcus thailandicus TaxID=417368 RepID=UPI003984CC3D
MSLMSINYFGYAVYNVTVEESIVNLLRFEISKMDENTTTTINIDPKYNNLISFEVTVESRNPEDEYDKIVDIISETNAIIIHLGSVEESYSTGEQCYMGIQTLTPANDFNDYIVTCIDDFFSEYQ